jgi:hypothetical protein
MFGPLWVALQQSHVIIDNLPHKDAWDYASIGITFALALIAAITFLAVRRQAIETAKAAKAAADSVEEMKQQAEILERQTKATETAAEAALLNAQAVIHSERPWLLIPIENKIYDIQPPVIIERRPGTHGALSSGCMFALKNYGRSPARVIEHKLWMIRIGDASFPPLSAYERKGGVKMDYVLAPDTTIPVQVLLEGGDGKLTTPEREAIDTEKNFLWLAGYIRYTDTFERQDFPIYETRFCYRWKPRSYLVPEPFWLREGPPEYNRTT